MDLQQETADVLGRLIRFNTVNPPGQERECQEYLAGYLTDAGFECELIGAEDERPNLIATLRGEADGPVLGYLSHVDTVLARPRTGRATRGRASCTTATCGAAARST